MKIDVKAWLAMDPNKRLDSIMRAVRQNDVSLKRTQKNLQALECE